MEKQKNHNFRASFITPNKEFFRLFAVEAWYSKYDEEQWVDVGLSVAVFGFGFNLGYESHED